jgi:hypothetical protein
MAGKPISPKDERCTGSWVLLLRSFFRYFILDNKKGQEINLSLFTQGE